MFPALDIAPVANASAARALLSDLQSCYGLVFVSRNAVRHGVPLLATLSVGDCKVFAVGKSTAQALADAGLAGAIWPANNYSARALLAVEMLQASRIANRRIVIVRGTGGSETLADGLRERGATVDYAEVYCRLRPAGPASALQKTPPDIMIATSGEVLVNLVEMFHEADSERLFAIPLVVSARRLHNLAGTAGFTGPILVAGSARDEDMIAALLDWTENKHSND